MPIRKLTVGPLIGHTTNSSVRLWGKGDSNDEWGVVRFKRQTPNPDGAYGDPKIFPLSKYYEYVGIVELFDLEPASAKYDYQIGILDGINETTVGDVAAWVAQQSLDWTHLDEFDFSLFPDVGGTEPVLFILGSCRDNWGDGGEKTFKAINTHLSRSHIDFILMMGDQIYIDHMGKFPSYKTRRYRKKYLKAFSKKYFSEVMSKLPAYMMLDDHEIKNGWMGKKLIESNKSKDKRAAKNGFRFYEAYQASLSPALERVSDFGENSFSNDLDEKHYWYPFSHGDIPFFVMDVRTESRFQEEGDDAPLISSNQLEELKCWLQRHDDDGVKFIVSSLPLFPDECYQKSRDHPKKEKWAGGRSQRREILKYLFENRNICRRVVFLSGDVHVSFRSRANYYNDGDVPEFWINQIVSSAFHWTVPGMQPGWFCDGGELLMPDVEQEPIVHIPEIEEIQQMDGFGEIEATTTEVTFNVYSKRGIRLKASYSLEFPNRA